MRHFLESVGVLILYGVGIVLAIAHAVAPFYWIYHNDALHTFMSLSVPFWGPVSMFLNMGGIL